ncbi:hypothetical protein [Thermobifida cellulosilytica]|jgi:hypothetical protein|uniref:Uncharacterized protein n=1 Tax=Thermobifida cellulosilytica TB100 TaxID=665004 RepID=A0A147KE65_THECS|nr:hypothetical protein [Thermobifida cellulosilytica]KUP95584.1 hypothetical protein AC529_16720 [Thermobifida cellulosilytica TB100]
MSAELVEVIGSVSTAGATTLVTAMVGDTWSAVRDRVSRILSRSTPEKEAERTTVIDEVHEEVVRNPEGDLSAQRERLRDLLREAMTEDFRVAEELLGLIRELTPNIGTQFATGNQHAHAEGQAQQAVQYSGTQTNTFTRDPRR